MEFNKKNLRSVNSFCRTCLAKLDFIHTNQRYNIYEDEHLIQWITICSTLLVRINDEYSKYICHKCRECIQQFQNFRDVSIRSHRKVQRIMSATKNQIVYKNESSPKQEMQTDSSDFRIDSKCDDKDEDGLVVTSLGDTIVYFIESNPERVEDEISTKLCFNTEFVINKEGENKDDSNSEQLESLNCDESLLKSTNKLKKIKEDATEFPERKILRFHCQQCPKRCINEKNLHAHMRVHQGLRPYICDQCDRTFNRFSRLSTHIKEVHCESIETISCTFEDCNKTFKRKDSFRMHLRIKHSNKSDNKKIYMCEDCGRTYKSFATLKEHRYKHASEEEYPHQCEICSKRFTSQRTYKEHLLRHNGIKNYECPYCGMKKTTRNELRTHINYHTKERQWPCKLCPSVFNSSANLGLHDRIVHKGIRRFMCRYCEQSFGKADTLKHHEMRHTGEKPHACPYCDKRFIQAVALRTHLKTHTNNNKRKLEVLE